jgi:N-acetyl-alpha-D-glucosaminyl L-malate synthase BshA
MVKLHKIEVLHVHYAIPHAYAAYMAKKMLQEEGIALPIVTTLHGTDITLVGSHPFYKSAVTFSINKSDAVTSVSQSLKDDTIRLFNIKKNIEVVPNFIDLSKYSHSFTDCQRSLMAKEDEKIITHISNFRPVKRIEDVITIFYNIQKEIPAKLMMVGDGPEKEMAEQMCKNLEIDNKVVFFGKSNEIDKILCFSDLFLLPSETESFGLVALEAMACGVPIISSNTGGLPEVNIQEVSGFLSDVGNVDDMTKNALHILQNENILKRFKENARKEAIKFDIHSIVPQYEAIYEKVLNKFSIV